MTLNCSHAPLHMTAMPGCLKFAVLDNENSRRFRHLHNMPAQWESCTAKAPKFQAVIPVQMMPGNQGVSEPISVNP